MFLGINLMFLFQFLTFSFIRGRVGGQDFQKMLQIVLQKVVWIFCVLVFMGVRVAICTLL